MMIELVEQKNLFTEPEALCQSPVSTPIQPIDALERATDIDTKRYQYWTGISGKRYICTVFQPNACPSVKGAVYIAVHRRPDGHVTPVCVGHFSSPFISGGKRSHHFGEALTLGANEIHMHLLADDPFEAEKISSDIEAQLFPADMVA